MLPSEKDATVIRSREAALNARNAITYQYATSTKKETKTPSTKKFPDPVLPRGPVRHIVSMNKTPRSNKREPVVLSSDEEHQSTLKRRFPNTPASSGSHSQRKDASPNDTISRDEFQHLQSAVTKLLTDACSDKVARQEMVTEIATLEVARQEMKMEIATLKESVVELSKMVDKYESAIDKIQIKALEALLSAERLQARFAQLAQLGDKKRE